MELAFPWISSIKIPNELGYIDSRNAPIGRLDNLSRVTLFVAPTGSGKSRLLRHLAAQKDPVVVLGSPRTSAISRLRRKAGAVARSLMKESSSTGSTLPHLKTFLEREEGPLSSFSGGIRMWHRMLEMLVGSASTEIARLAPDDVPQNTPTDRLADTLEQLLQLTRNSPELPFSASGAYHSRVYIPSLRTLVPLGNSSAGDRALLDSTALENYFNSDDRAVWLVTGADLADKVKQLTEGPKQSGFSINEFEQFLGEEVLGLANMSLTVPAGSDRIHVALEEEPHRPVHLLGDGLSHLIILTFPIAFGGSRVFYYEEPELGLDPRLQRAFLKSIDRFGRLYPQQYFMTTHSNHLLDIAMDRPDVSVLRFEKLPGGEPQFKIRNVKWSDRPLLEALGVKLSSVALANATVWVEGMTDRLFYSHVLRVYQASRPEVYQLQEGVHFSLNEYGGANLPHWSFLDSDAPQIDVDKLCGPALLVIDKDDSEWKGRREIELKRRLEERLFVTPGRELENLVGPETLAAVAAEFGGSLPSNSTWKEYSVVPMGRYLEEAAGVKNVQAKSGTLKTDKKRDFVEVVMRAVEDFTQLPEEVQAFVERMHQLLVRLNK